MVLASKEDGLNFSVFSTSPQHKDIWLSLLQPVEQDFFLKSNGLVLCTHGGFSFHKEEETVVDAVKASLEVQEGQDWVEVLANACTTSFKMLGEQTGKEVSTLTFEVVGNKLRQELACQGKARFSLLGFFDTEGSYKTSAVATGITDFKTTFPFWRDLPSFWNTSLEEVLQILEFANQVSG